MTNYEKNKEQLDMYSVAGVAWGVDESGKVFECSCGDCIFDIRNICSHSRLNWLQEEYKEPEVDWAKVELDTPILVRDNDYSEWENAHFAGCMCGVVCTFDSKHTSKNFNFITSWNYAKLAEEDD